MVIKHHIKGYDNFCEFVKKFKQQDLVHIYFSGTKLPTGESWCSDCVRAWPIIKEVLEKATDDSHFVYVEVGDRSTWKDPNCLFRKDPHTKLNVLPTLLRWKSPQKLEGDQCEKKDLVEMLFNDEDD